ncbi:MAG TPA: metallophosphoesterase, partial [Pyrinomonadaceae bacterium]|nr:metallophosphoesterase [Pyrinomonadaceae bacterium]
MPRIKYVCLSDMHLGAENSLLTKLTPDCADTEPTKPSPVLVQLVECLKSLIAHNEGEKPTLILNGDILELALTTDNLAAMAFERFIEQIFPANGDRLFKDVFYIPGNHDHHLWETARETQYVNFISSNSEQQPGSLLKVPWHTTKMFDPTPPVPA